MSATNWWGWCQAHAINHDDDGEADVAVKLAELLVGAAQVLPLSAMPQAAGQLRTSCAPP